MPQPGVISPASSLVPRLPRATLLLLLLGLLVTSGCIGGGQKRDADTGVAIESSHWVFPLYHYREKQGEQTVTPFFLVPIPIGRTDEVVIAGGAESFPTTSGIDSPSWSDEASGAGLGGPPSSSVEPGLWASSVPPHDAGVAAAGEVRSHRVRQGETLYSLATRYYGSGREWRRIADANRDRLPAPEKLSVGIELRIP